jgi:hypothetical protein
VIFATRKVRRYLIKELGPQCRSVIEEAISDVPLFKNQCPVLMDNIDKYLIRFVCAPGEWDCHGNCAQHWVTAIIGKNHV